MKRCPSASAPGSGPAPPAGRWSVLAAALLWGTTGTAATFAPANVPAAVLGAAGMGLGGIVLLLAGGRDARVVLRGALGRHRGTPIGGAILAGAVAVALYPLCFYSAMHVGGVALGVTTTIGSSPVAAAGFERVLTGEPLPRGLVAGGAAALVGTAVLGTASLGLAGRSYGAILTGVGLGLLAGSGYGAYSVAGARAIQAGASSRRTMGAMFGLASIALLGVVVASAAEVLATPRGAAVIGYLALVPMGAGYVLFGRGLRSTTATAATTLSLAEPVVAALFARVVAGQPVTALGWVGIGLVAAGVLVTARRVAVPIVVRPEELRGG